MKKSYGVYIRTSDLEIWRLDRITWLEDTWHEDEFNAQFGFQTLIVGPWTVFPEFIET
jgi:hypothetical protein